MSKSAIGSSEVKDQIHVLDCVANEDENKHNFLETAFGQSQNWQCFRCITSNEMQAQFLSPV